MVTNDNKAETIHRGRAPTTLIPHLRPYGGSTTYYLISMRPMINNGNTMDVIVAIWKYGRYIPKTAEEKQNDACHRKT